MNNSSEDKNKDFKKQVVKTHDHGITHDWKMSPDDYESALHELHNYQIELELQNDELRKAQQELAEVRDQYANLYEFAPVGYIVLDPINIITDTNITICKMLGANRLSLYNKDIFDIISPDSKDIFYLTIRKIFDFKSKQECEVKLLKKDKNEFHAKLECAPQEDSKGNISGIRVVVIDITELKKKEAELKQSKEQKKVIFETVPTSIIILDKNGKITDVTPYLVTHHGKGKTTKKDYIGKDITTHPSIVNAGLSDTYKKLLEGVPFYKKDVYFPVTSGTLDGYFNVKGEPLFKGQEIVGAVTTHEDITERKKAEKILAKETYYLCERIKEHDCRNKISILIETPGITLNEIYQGAVDLIPPAWQYPSITAARLSINEETFETADFSESQWKLKADIVVNAKKLGTLQVFYTEEKTEEDIGPFHNEEKYLLNVIAERLGRITERNKIEQKLLYSEAQKKAILDGITANIAFVNDKLEILWANKTAADSINMKVENMLGQKCYKLWANSDKPCNNCTSLKVLQTGKSEHTLMLSPDGKVWDERGEPVFDPDGKLMGVVEIAQDITEKVKMDQDIKDANKKLEKLAFIDSLTGLINRKPFIDLLDKNISRAKREKQKIAVLYMDLENFKKVNDIYGHEIGDKLLVQAAEKIKKQIRDSDFAGRIGGDEFVLCLNDIKSLSGATRIAKEINDAFADKIIIQKIKVDLGISIGIAIYPEDGWSTNDLLKNSDMAMYKAKKHHKNSFHVYNAKLQKELFFNYALENALQNNEYKMRYQTIVDRNQKPFCAEALLRWESPEFGTILPMNFIPRIETNRSIVEVGEWGFKEVCTKLKAFDNKHNEKILVSFNISQHQIEDELFIDKIQNVISETKLDPSKIIIEITEKSKITDIEKVKETIKKLKEIGIGFIALDDFGTGYSSISNLINFPIDIVKIDNFFINRLNDKKYCKITASLIALIKKFNILSIAEGVETKQQFELLRGMGCDYFQGFYFSKPQSKLYPLLV